MELADAFLIYCNALALVYHEARNVRHLLRAGLIGRDRPWQKLVHVPTNRYDAWHQISPLVQKARTKGDVAAANDIFVADFGVTLNDLTTMFENREWRHAKAYGGNAWAEITKTTLALGDALSADDQELATVIGLKLEHARHNTGSLKEKLLDLNRVIAGQC